MKQPSYRVVFTVPASRDFEEIMDWSTTRFGDAAANRYETLFGKAFIDLSADPFLPGAKRRNDLAPGVYTYHLAFSRLRVPGDRVHALRYFIVYRVAAQLIEVLRFLHDSRDLARHIPLQE